MNTIEENNTDLNTENNIPVVTEDKEERSGNKRSGTTVYRIVMDVVMLALIVVLFILHFTGNQGQTIQYPAAPPAGTPGSGEVVYINIDTINAQYELVTILTKDIENERAKQEAIFNDRQKALEAKYSQFQQNYSANVLTPVQIQNTQEQLMQESERLQAEYEQVFGNLQNRQMAALQQIADSLFSVTRRINTARNASFIFSYQYGGQLILADPTKDITTEVLFELNRPYQK